MIRFEVGSGLFETGVRQSWTCTSVPRPEPVLTQIAMTDRDEDHLSQYLEILSQLQNNASLPLGNLNLLSTVNLFGERKDPKIFRNWH